MQHAALLGNQNCILNCLVFQSRSRSYVQVLASIPLNEVSRHVYVVWFEQGDLALMLLDCSFELCVYTIVTFA